MCCCVQASEHLPDLPELRAFFQQHLESQRDGSATRRLSPSSCRQQATNIRGFVGFVRRVLGHKYTGMLVRPCLPPFFRPNIILQLQLVPQSLAAPLGAGSGQGFTLFMDMDIIAQACQPQPNIILPLQLVPENLAAPLGAVSGLGITL